MACKMLGGENILSQPCRHLLGRDTSVPRLALHILERQPEGAEQDMVWSKGVEPLPLTCFGRCGSHMTYLRLHLLIRIIPPVLPVS